MAVVVITGASSGIGEATAHRLARQGHTLVLAARRGDRLTRLAAALEAERAGPAGPRPRPGPESADKPAESSSGPLPSRRVLCVPTDLADPRQIEALAQVAGEQCGRIDVWINNAGIGSPSPTWWEASAEEIRHVLDVDLVAPLLCVRAALPWMLRELPRPHSRPGTYGHFIQVGSVAGHIGVRSPYSAAKFGLRGFAESLRRELAGYGLYVSLVSPGFIRTPMTADAHIPFGLPSPDRVAQAIARLMEHPRREVVVPGWYRLPIYVNRVLPGLVDLALGWFYRHQDRYVASVPRRRR